MDFSWLERCIYCTVWVRKIPPLTFFPNGWEFLVQIFRDYYTFLSTQDYNALLSYLQLRWSYAILSATTQRAFRPMVDILSIWCELGGRALYGITLSKLLLIE